MIKYKFYISCSVIVTENWLFTAKMVVKNNHHQFIYC